MLVACDVDGVVLDLLPEWLRRYNRDYDDYLIEAQITAWDTHKYTKPECGLKMYDYLKASDLYDNLPPLPGAVEGCKSIRAMGHELGFVTSCTYGMVDQKARRLEELGFCESRDGHGLPSELVVCNTKRWINADVLIDDRGQTIKEWVKTGRRAILIEMPYNRNLDLTSSEWQRVIRVSAHPDRALAWPAIVDCFVRGEV